MIWKTQGRLKIDLLPYSLREIWQMADGLQEQDEIDWNHTSAIMATLANIHRDPKRRAKPFSPNEFHPYRAKRITSGRPLTGDVLRARWQAHKAKLERKAKKNGDRILPTET